MANHVYFTIHIEGIDDELFNKHVKTETKVGKTMLNEEYNYQAISEIEEQPFMADVDKDFDKDGYLIDSYDWYCNNVGAKWCHIEEIGDGYISGHSAWRQPHELVINLLEFYAAEKGCVEDDYQPSASMTYEDEFRNFMGKQYYGVSFDFEAAEAGEVSNLWTAWEGDYTETDGTELCEQFHDLYPSIKSNEDDFEWDGEYEVEGEKIYPSEVLDELADDFWSRC